MNVSYDNIGGADSFKKRRFEQINFIKYAAPLVVTLPFFMAAVVALLWNARTSNRATDERAANIAHTEKGVASRKTGGIFIRSFLLAVLAVYFLTQFYAYFISSAHNTFQTSGCIGAPSDDTPIIDYLKQKHISYALTTAWLGDPITFNTQISIIATQPQSRIPINSYNVLHAAHYALLVFTNPNNSDPAILQTLGKNHYAYQVQRFPTIPGWDVMVIITQKNVSPLDPTFKAVLQPLHDQCIRQ